MSNARTYRTIAFLIHCVYKSTYTIHLFAEYAHRIEFRFPLPLLLRQAVWLDRWPYREELNQRASHLSSRKSGISTLLLMPYHKQHVHLLVLFFKSRKLVTSIDAGLKLIERVVYKMCRETSVPITGVLFSMQVRYQKLGYVATPYFILMIPGANEELVRGLVDHTWPLIFLVSARTIS